MIFESKVDSSVRVDLIALGYGDPLVLSTKGTFDEGPFGRGRAGIEEGRLALDYGSGHKQLYTFLVRGDTLLLGNQDDDQFDFDGDGRDEPASMTAVMVRHR